MRRRLFFLPLALTALAGAADPLRMEVQPLYEGQDLSYGYLPMRVEAENDGPPAQGELVVDAEGQRIVYPVDLPTGARKRLPIYLNLTWSGAKVILRTDRGTVLKEISGPGGGYEQGIQQVLMVTESPGELAALRTLGKTEGNPGLVRDSYVRPEQAPERPLAYQGASAVLLGEGSERLSDDAVAALRNYVVMGGTVVMFGGASAPVLSDPRWADLAPVGEGRVETRESLHIANTDLEGPLSIVRAKARAGAIVRDASGSTPTIVERPVGLGRILFLAVNPTETKASGADVAGMLTRALRLTDGNRGRQLLSAYTNESGVENNGTARIADDPFRAELPPFETIALILGGFFIVAIPVNFLLLRALKKGELAWFTAPVLSLGFAGLLFAKAGDLYAAKTSTATGGALILQQGLPQGWFVGDTSFFIPSGGVYDLKLQNVDSLGELASANSDPFTGRAQQSALDAVDDGRNLIVPALRANNLAFRSLAYRQAVPNAGGWFTVTSRKIGKDAVDWTVRNDSPYTLKGAYVMLGTNGMDIKELKQGESKHGSGTFLNEVSPGTPPGIAGDSPGSLGSFSWRTRRPMLTGFVYGFRPGPQIGTEIKERTSIRLIDMGAAR